MSLRYVREAYDVPAFRGARIRFEGARLATIIDGRNGRLRVKFDGASGPSALHPTWCVEYLDADADGVVASATVGGRP